MKNYEKSAEDGGETDAILAAQVIIYNKCSFTCSIHFHAEIYVFDLHGEAYDT